MFRRILNTDVGYYHLCNAVGTGVTRVARVMLANQSLTDEERRTECARLVNLYRAVSFKRIVDGSDEAYEVAILLRAVPETRANEWDVANQIQWSYGLAL